MAIRFFEDERLMSILAEASKEALDKNRKDLEEVSKKVGGVLVAMSHLPVAPIVDQNTSRVIGFKESKVTGHYMTQDTPESIRQKVERGESLSRLQLEEHFVSINMPPMTWYQ